MKKHLSVFGLFARSSIYKVIGILAFLLIAEVGLFGVALARDLSEDYTARFEHFVEISHVDLCLGVAFILITVVLCLPGTEFGSKVGYTIQRLSVSERTVFYYQAVFNTLTYILLWAFQIGVLYALGLWYCISVPADAINNQSVFLAFYRNDFMHTILPLSEVMLWIRNFLLIISLSVASAEFPYIQRRKKHSTFIVPIAIFILLFFVTGIGNVENITASIIIFIIVVCKTLYDIYHKEDSYDK